MKQDPQAYKKQPLRQLLEQVGYLWQKRVAAAVVLLLLGATALQAQDRITLNDEEKILYGEGPVDTFREQEPEKAPKDRKDRVKPRHFLVLGTGMSRARGDWSTDSDEPGTKAKGGYNGEILYGFYPHPNVGVDFRAGVGFFRAEFNASFNKLLKEVIQPFELETLGVGSEWSFFEAAYLTLGPTARLPLKSFDIHLGVQGGPLFFTEPRIDKSGHVIARLQSFGLDWQVSEVYTASNARVHPKQTTTFTYGGNLAIVFRPKSALTLRAEAGYYVAHVRYDELIKVDIGSSFLPFAHRVSVNHLSRDLSIGMLQFRIGVGVKF